MLCKFNIILESEIRNIGHYVIGPVWKIAFEACVPQNGNNEVTFPLIFALKLSVITCWKAQSICAGMLKRICGAYGQKVMYLPNRRSDLGRSDTVSDSPAGNRIGF